MLADYETRRELYTAKRKEAFKIIKNLLPVACYILGNEWFHEPKCQKIINQINTHELMQNSRTPAHVVICRLIRILKIMFNEIERNKDLGLTYLGDLKYTDTHKYNKIVLEIVNCSGQPTNNNILDGFVEHIIEYDKLKRKCVCRAETIFNELLMPTMQYNFENGWNSRMCAEILSDLYGEIECINVCVGAFLSDAEQLYNTIHFKND